MNENTKTCYKCGCVDEELVTIFVDGEYREVCADCARELGYEVCDHCGEWFHNDDLVWAADGRDHVCGDCLDEHYAMCDHCGEYYPTDEMETDSNNTWVCDYCFEHYFFRCADCGGIFDRDEMEEYGMDTLCEDCYRERCENDPYHEYDYKPEPEFQFAEGEDRYRTLTFGVECEVDDGHDAHELAETLTDMGLPIYCKHDGSLGDEGVEIVTHPASLAFHANGMGWKRISRACTDREYRSHDTSTCGLHIHVGRSAMGATQQEEDRTVANIVILVESLWDSIVKFSRRRSGALNHWAARPELREFKTVNRWSTEKVNLDLSTNEGLMESALATVERGRYQAVNLTNANTVEIRVFRGTLKVSTILASLQLVSNLTKYAMTHTPLECRAAKFTDILSVEEYTELNEYATVRGLM